MEIGQFRGIDRWKNQSNRLVEPSYPYRLYLITTNICNPLRGLPGHVVPVAAILGVLDDVAAAADEQQQLPPFPPADPHVEFARRGDEAVFQDHEPPAVAARPLLNTS